MIQANTYRKGCSFVNFNKAISRQREYEDLELKSSILPYFKLLEICGVLQSLELQEKGILVLFSPVVAPCLAGY